MNKKVAIEFAIGVIIIVAIILGVAFWILGKQKIQNCAKEGERIGAQGMPSACCSGLKPTGSQSFAEAPGGLLVCESSITKNESANKIPNPATSEVDDWQTYRNEELGIEFKHPSNYGNIEVTKFSKGDPARPANTTQLNFNNQHYVNMALYLNDVSSHYSDGYTYNRLDKKCDSLKNCKIISLSGSDVAFIKSSFSSYECSPMFRLVGYLKNKNYQNIEISVILRDAQNKISDIYTCENEEKEKAANLIVDNIIEDVFNKKAISNSDKIIFDEFEKILSTFKIIN